MVLVLLSLLLVTLADLVLEVSNMLTGGLVLVKLEIILRQELDFFQVGTIYTLQTLVEILVLLLWLRFSVLRMLMELHTVLIVTNYILNK